MVSEDPYGTTLSFDHTGMYHRIFIGFPWDPSNYYEIPVIPEMIAGSDGQTVNVYNILSLGEVSLLGGRKIQKLSWESHFPMLYDSSIEHMAEADHIHPEQWKQWFQRAQAEHTWVRVSILRAGIDRRFAVSEFNWSYIPGPAGDLWYQLHLVEYRETFVREFDGSSFPDVDVRPPPYGSLPATYTSKPGQTLQDISLILFGTTTQWLEIYKYNVSTLLGPVVYAEQFEDFNVPEFEAYMDLWEATQPVPAGTVLVIPKGLSVVPVVG